VNKPYSRHGVIQVREKWTCPYCNRPCTVGDQDVSILGSEPVFINDKYGWYVGKFTVITCPTPGCEKQTMFATVYTWQPGVGHQNTPLYSFNLIPESNAKPFPDYIPQQLRDDYTEACSIKTKSPKASATLCRRCLQGMIRDFWKIKGKRLYDEIQELREKIDGDSWEAIDSVRAVGNIGAHMEADVDLIIDVEEGEADLLIGLIETLFEEWYVAKHVREERMANVANLAATKKAARQAISQTTA